MPEEPETPGAVEAWAAAVALCAFALSAVLLRGVLILPPEVLDAAALVLAAWGLAPLLHRKAGRLAATLLRGAGLATGTLLLARTLAPPFDAALAPLALAILAGTLLHAQPRTRAVALLTQGAGLLLLALAWGVALWLAPRFPETGRLRFALFLAAPIFAAGLALRAVLRRRGHDALAPTPVGILLAGAIAGAYLGYRGLVADHVENLPLYEWTLGVAIGALVLARLRRQARAAEVPEAWENEARKHAPDVTPLPDPRMGPVAAVVTRYLQAGQGFDDYRKAMERLGSATAYRKALEALRPVPPARGRAGKQAADARLAAHRSLLLTLRSDRGPAHGTSAPPLRPNP